jgi:hypothetical protein
LLRREHQTVQDEHNENYGRDGAVVSDLTALMGKLIQTE